MLSAEKGEYYLSLLIMGGAGDVSLLMNAGTWLCLLVVCSLWVAGCWVDDCITITQWGGGFGGGRKRETGGGGLEGGGRSRVNGVLLGVSICGDPVGSGKFG